VLKLGPFELTSLKRRHGRNQMLRSILSAVALAGVIAAAQPALADAVITTASEYAQPAAAATQPPATPVPVSPPRSSEAPAPAGFGWG
jgi:hypothetical protein